MTSFPIATISLWFVITVFSDHVALLYTYSIFFQTHLLHGIVIEMQSIKQFIYHRAPTFHMPESISAPIIMVGPGTGIAPFRGFWHHRRHLIQHSKQEAGPAWLYFGCKYKDMDLYKEEKEKVVEEKVIHKARLAMSREVGVEKVNVRFVIPFK